MAPRDCSTPEIQYFKNMISVNILAASGNGDGAIRQSNRGNAIVSKYSLKPTKFLIILHAANLYCLIISDNG